MIVVCLFAESMPNEVQMAYGDGAGSVQLVTAARLLRAEAERLLSSGEIPRGRGETGDIGAFREVSAGDVCVRVTWADQTAPPELDYAIAAAADPDQLLTCALTLDEYVRFGIWSSRMAAQAQQLHVDQERQRQAQERAAVAIARAANLPPDLRYGRD